MRLGKLLVYFETSPAIRLLRSQNAPFILDFLEERFKQPGAIAIAHSELIAALSSYREDLQKSYPDALPSRPEVYLNEWCSTDTRWLQRFLEAGRNEAVYQLTPHTEDVFAFLDRVLEKDLGFIGTESRLKLIVDTLEDILIGSSDDPQRRLQYLHDELTRVQKEIDQIETSGNVSKYQPALIRERFVTAVSLLRQLQGDFRAVEESFRDITVQVQQREIEGRESRGGILAFALDSEELLKNEDQGVSFYEFVRLILSPTKTEKLERTIQQVRKIPELFSQADGQEAIRGMVSLLQNEAEKVMRTNQRLSATLRRLLDSKGHAERQQVARLLQEIRSHAITLSGLQPQEIGIDIETSVEVDSPGRYALWEEPMRINSSVFAEHVTDEQARRQAFLRLASIQRLDWKEMRRKIDDAVRIDGSLTLSALLKRNPPKSGAIEVIGYVQIARDDGHNVNTSSCEEILIPPLDPTTRAFLLRVPVVTFLPIRKTSHA